MGVCVTCVVEPCRHGLVSCSKTGVPSAVYKEIVWVPAAKRVPGKTGSALESKEERPETDVGVVSVGLAVV